MEGCALGITAKQISKQFGQTKVLQNVNLSIRNGELISLLGPSGSGKTTLLRIIAGLDYANNGQILFGDQDYTHSSTKTADRFCVSAICAFSKYDGF